MKIALAQINSFLGDFKNNRLKITNYIEMAANRGCDLVVFPEACLFGYHPADLLERPGVVNQQLKELKFIEKYIPTGITAVFGAISKSTLSRGKLYNNSAVVVKKSTKIKFFGKELLPSYDVFDESRHIEPGDVSKNIIKIKGQKVLITICEDIWAWNNPYHGKRSPYRTNPLTKIKEVDYVINLSASPYTKEKRNAREVVCKQTAKKFKAPVIYVNMVGGQDELIFDGASFVTLKNGKIVARASQFNEDILIYDDKLKRGFVNKIENNATETLRQALVLGLKDFIRKIGFSKVHLGLSGGIDSALVACLAVDALGPLNVSCIMLPGPFSTAKSSNLATKLVENLDVSVHSLNIESIYSIINKEFQKIFGNHKFGLLNQNFQARIRGLLLMGVSNKEHSLLLNTSNKSELATGYSTLYGDLVGGISPLGDLTKTEVFALANLYNAQYELIPKQIISRPPSAELSPNQKDSDNLPPYDVLDPMVVNLVEKLKPAKNSLEQKILGMMVNSEFKRWQAPPILKVSNHAFGRGRRLPIAHAAKL